MAETKEKDLYVILGVKEDADADAIKKAYRTLAKKLHPDRTGGDKAKELRFKDISAAYEVLSDPKRRQQYDAMRRGGFQPGPGGAAPDFSAFDGIEGIEDLLGSLFGGARRRGGGGGQPRSRVVFQTGGQAQGFPGMGGFAFEEGFRPAAPEVPTRVRTPDGHVLETKGDDVYGDVEITLDEAVLGAKVPVSTLDGRATVTIPAGTSSGRKLRLRGKGMRGGDHYATIQIIVPEKVDGRTEELVRELARRAPVKLRR